MSGYALHPEAFNDDRVRRVLNIVISAVAVTWPAWAIGSSRATPPDYPVGFVECLCRRQAAQNRKKALRA